MLDYELSKSRAHQRMIFEDFFWVAFAIGLKRGQRIKESKPMRVRIDKPVNDAISSVMPFKLTRAQKKVTAEIFNDMKSTAPMNRLLQGDVGSGKTIVAVIAMIAQHVDMAFRHFDRQRIRRSPRLARSGRSG